MKEKLLLLTFAMMIPLIATAQHKVFIPIETFDTKQKGRGKMTGWMWDAPNSKKKLDGYSNQKKRQILLIHMYGGSSQDWMLLIEKWRAQDFEADILAIDLRDRGKGSGSYVFIEDIQSAVAYLRSRQTPHASAGVSIIAAGVGANGALQYATASPQMAHIIDSLTLISPGQTFGEMPALEAIEHINNIPILLIAARDEHHTYSTARDLLRKCKSMCSEFSVSGSGQGTDLLRSKYGMEVSQTITKFMLNPRSYGNTR